MSKVVLVTGSTSGIGEATGRLFATRGDRVIFNSRSSAAAGEALAKEYEGASYVQGDIAVPADVDRMVKEIADKYGRLDVLVNNAGTTKVIPHHDFAAATVDVFREIFETNVFGTWRMSVAAMDLLKSSHGNIVNVSSVAGIRPSGSSIPYAASKAALNHLTTLMAKVSGPEVRVNAVAPGLIDTPWTADWDALRKYVSEVTPARRSGTPEDIAGAIYTLANSPYVTGQVFVVDGGLTIIA
jgi:ketoreductase RED2